LALATTIAALPLVVLTLIAGDVPIAWLPVLFLAVAVVIGVGVGFGSLVYHDMMGRVFAQTSRGKLLFVAAAVSGIAVGIVAMISQSVEGFDPDVPPVVDHLHLIWAGAGMLMLSSVWAMAIREPGRTMSRLRGRAKFKGYGAALKDSLRITAKLPWLRRFMVARILFVSVELTMPFLAVHAAESFVRTTTSLSMFVISSGIGLVLGGFVWTRVSRKSAVLVMTASCLVGFAAAVIALASYFIEGLQSTATEAGVMVLLTFATQGIIGSSPLYVVNAATEKDRPYCIAIANFPAGVVGIGMALGLGGIAANLGIFWVLAALAILNLVSAFYARTLREYRPGEKEVPGKNR
jgi:hypothetical protein